MAGTIAADPSSEPSETYRVRRMARTKTGVASRTATGWMTSIVPTPAPTPRPLRNPAKMLQMAPITAAPPHSTSTTGSPVTTRARRTGSAPLRRSPITTTAAHFRPSARSALVPPVRPDPIDRRSGPPTRRATSDPTGIEPARYAIPIRSRARSRSGPIDAPCAGWLRREVRV